jgi:CheY-like chemotaxis protein
MLENWGHAVVVAGDGAAAVAALEEGHFDLVLMDVQMPVMSGFEATARIRAREKETGLPHVPVIAMTAHAMKGDREKCLEAGMNDYVSKPVQKASLCAVIENLLETSGRQGQDSVPAGSAGLIHPPVDLDPELLAEVVDLFLQHCPHLVSKIEAAINNNDAQALHTAAHSLKGSASNFGVKAVQETLQELETLGRMGNLDRANDAFSRLKCALQDMELALRALLPEAAL